MWKDPIVEETRKLREEYAAQFDHDLDRIFEDIRKREREEGKNIVNLAPREPRKKPESA